MAKFNFDSEQAEQLYWLAVRGDAQAAATLHECSQPLFEVIAWSVTGSSDVHDDLTQEAHLKLALVLQQDTYCPSRGSMYSFLSVIIKNHMIDVLSRRGWICEDLNEGADVPAGANLDEVKHKIAEYTLRRFSKVDPHVTMDATLYVIDATVESVNDRSRGIIRTMCAMYMMERSTAWSIYWSVVAVLRMEFADEVIDWQTNIPKALAAIEEHGCLSVLPELTLLSGDAVEDMARIFKGSYVKF